MIKMNIKKFVDRRKELRISQVKMCEGICTQSTLSKFESSGRVPSLVILTQLCTRIGLTIDDLNSDEISSTNQIQKQLDTAERQLAMGDYQTVLQTISAIDEEQISPIPLRIQFYYLRGMLNALINRAPEVVLYDFSQILNDLDERHDTIFSQLAYVGSGLTYIRKQQFERAQFYFCKVNDFIKTQLEKPQSDDDPRRDDLRLLTLIFYTAYYYALQDQLKTSDELIDTGMNLCSIKHVTYYLPRLKFLAAENAIREKKEKDHVEGLMTEARVFAHLNKNQIITVKLAALRNRYAKGLDLKDLLP